MDGVVLASQLASLVVSQLLEDKISHNVPLMESTIDVTYALNSL